MGRCVEFGRTITDGCDHPMVPDGESCFCTTCATRCTGHFVGCASVWARGLAPVAITVPPRTTAATSTASRPEQPLVADRADPIADAAVDGPPDGPLTIDWTAPAGPVVAERRGTTPTPRHARTRRRRRTIAFAVAGIAILVVGAVVLAGGGSDSPASVATTPTGPAQLRFAPFSVGDTAVQGTRLWRLEGEDGDHFSARLSFTNRSEAPVTTSYQEVIPKTLARHVSGISFRPAPVVVNPDPIVRYDLSLAPGQTFTATYDIPVDPDGADVERLQQWAQDAETELAQQVEAAAEALANAKTLEEAAAAQAALDAARAAQAAFTPTRTPPRRGSGAAPPPDCTTYCGGPETTPTDPPTVPTDPPTTATDPPTTVTSEPPTTTETTVSTPEGG